MEQETIGLFPLHAVLVPGAAIGLRVFEPRYLDLVRECGRSGGCFGVCMILAGEEAGTAATPAAFGTEARIEDFGTDDSGVLTLRVRGHRRFRVARTRVRDNGLLMGDVEWRDPDGDDELRPEHAVLGMLLQRILEQVDADGPDPGPRQIDNAAWVGWRLAELLPMSDRQRQSLLQEDDPHERLQQLLALVSDETP